MDDVFDEVSAKATDKVEKAAERAEKAEIRRLTLAVKKEELEFFKKINNKLDEAKFSMADICNDAMLVASREGSRYSLWTIYSIDYWLYLDPEIRSQMSFQVNELYCRLHSCMYCTKIIM